jgi:hypothetical protein
MPRSSILKGDGEEMVMEDIYSFVLLRVLKNSRATRDFHSSIARGQGCIPKRGALPARDFI